MTDQPSGQSSTAVNASDNQDGDEPSKNNRSTTERAQIRASWGTLTSASVAVLSLAVAVTSLVFSLQAKGKPISVSNPPDAPLHIVQDDSVTPPNVRPCPDSDSYDRNKSDAPHLTVQWDHSEIDAGRLVAIVSYWRDEVAPKSLGVAARGPMGLRDAEDIPFGTTPVVPNEGACGSIFRKSRENPEAPEAQYVVFDKLFSGEIYCFGVFPNIEVENWSEWTECSIPKWDSEWGAPDIRPK